MDSDGTCNFGFAFNDPKFSDRVLSIEIIADPVETRPNGFVSTQYRKRSRGGFVKQENGEGTSMQRGDHTVNYNMPDVEDSIASENQDEDGDAMIEESSSGCLLGFNKSGTSLLGDEATRRHDAARSRDFSTVLRVKTIHISSAILAVKSPFFYKLFSNGMRDSKQRVATLRIHASEEPALMELLNFMYNNTLSTTTSSSLLNILIAADKFEVTSCMRYCSQRLSKLPMTCDSALSYLDLPSSVLHADALQQLTDSAKQFIAVQFRDMNKFKDQVLNLPLAGIEAVLSNDDIQVASEDVVYDLVLKWAELHYPQLEERREVLETRLRHLIRFPYMTSRKLKKVIKGSAFSSEVASNIVLEALFFKTEKPYRQRQLASGRHAAGESSVDAYHRFMERAYKYRPIRAVELELPRHHCIAYLDLKREECVHLFPAGKIYSEAFHLGRQAFFLSAHCSMEQQNDSQCFGLFLGMQEKGAAGFAFDYNFAAWSKEEENYKTKYKGNFTFAGGRAVGLRNLFKIPWATFVADDSAYFINGILHLRAEVTMQ